MIQPKVTVPLLITVQPGQVVQIKFEDKGELDVRFEVHFDTVEHPKSMLLKEVSGYSGNVVGAGNEVLYHEDFSFLRGDDLDDYVDLDSASEELALATALATGEEAGIESAKERLIAACRAAGMEASPFTHCAKGEIEPAFTISPFTEDLFKRALRMQSSPSLPSKWQFMGHGTSPDGRETWSAGCWDQALIAQFDKQPGAPITLSFTADTSLLSSTGH